MAKKTGPLIKCLHSEMVRIEKLKPHPRDPNKHGKEQITLFAKILKYQGVRRPVRVSSLSGLLTAGHGQLMAFKENGWLSCPVEYQDYDSPEQEYADLVADNSLAAWAQVDLLSIEEATAGFKNFDWSVLGIDGFKVEVPEITFPETRGKNELTKDEKTSEYMASQSRNIVLVYSLTEFNRITELMGRAMAAEGQESFSDTVKALLEKYARDHFKKAGDQRKGSVPGRSKRR
jgi:hypothetical protein